MSSEKIIESFFVLKEYCEKENYMGWDPYDGLNSRVFQAIPFLRKSAICRLIMIQGFKRNPLNFRKLALIPKGHNPKGIGLFLSGYCNLYHFIKKNPTYAKQLTSLDEIKERIIYLSELLISIQSKGYSGACWGYNFDWQARKLFLFPKYTPTIVATSFCATALFDAYEIVHNEKWLEIALSSANFITQDLHRTKCNQDFLFSYSPLDGNDTVYNASILGARLLSYCYKYTYNNEYKNIAYSTIRACCDDQCVDGSWPYGKLPAQSWIDSFHTGYNLDGLIAYQELTGDNSFNENIKRGLKYYTTHFFKSDGTPMYYHNRMYPIDIHCPGQLLVTLHRLHSYKENKDLLEKTLQWTLTHMQSSKGYFYYQIKRGISSKISYMRWSNAFMFHALSCYLLNL